MKLEVEEIKDIHPTFISSNQPLGVSMKIFMNKRQAESLFYTIWEEYEGGEFEKWIDAEGYKLVKKEST